MVWRGWSRKRRLPVRSGRSIAPIVVGDDQRKMRRQRRMAEKTPSILDCVAPARFSDLARRSAVNPTPITDFRANPGSPQHHRRLGPAPPLRFLPDHVSVGSFCRNHRLATGLPIIRSEDE